MASARKLARREKRKRQREERGGSRFGVFLKKSGNFLKKNVGVLGGIAATALTGGVAAPLALKGIVGKGILTKAKGLVKKIGSGANSPVGAIYKDVMGGKSKIEELIGGIDLKSTNSRSLAGSRSFGSGVNTNTDSIGGNASTKSTPPIGSTLTKLGLGYTLLKMFM